MRLVSLGTHFPACIQTTSRPKTIPLLHFWVRTNRVFHPPSSLFSWSLSNPFRPLPSSGPSSRVRYSGKRKVDRGGGPQTGRSGSPGPLRSFSPLRTTDVGSPRDWTCSLRKCTYSGTSVSATSIVHSRLKSSLLFLVYFPNKDRALSRSGGTVRDGSRREGVTFEEFPLPDTKTNSLHITLGRGTDLVLTTNYL